VLKRNVYIYIYIYINDKVANKNVVIKISKQLMVPCNKGLEEMIINDNFLSTIYSFHIS
jgi:hypothetical protein